MDKSKPFGLVLPKKAKAFPAKVNAIFGSDSDDEPVKKKSVPIPQKKPLSKIQEQKELCEDPSIYEYDSIYDDMKAKEVAKIAAPKDNKPSRYINTLLKAADKRKKEYERRVERKVQVEREKEGDKFKDKEAFVTSAYKQKMQEMEEEEERERRENLMNEMMDVTKQKDLSGFYRHFLKQSVGEEKIPEFGDKFKVKQEPVSDEEAKKTYHDQKKRKDCSKSEVKREDHSSKTKRRRHDQSDEDDSDHHSYKSLKKNTERVSDAKISKDSKVPHVSSRKTAIYRRHEHSSEDEEKYNPSSSKSEADKLLAANLDQDSDIVDSEEEVDSKIKISSEKHRSKNTSDSDRGKDNVQKKKMAKNIRKRTNDDSDASDSSKENEENSLPSNENSTNGKTENTVEDEQPKVKRNIFEKRTVGEVFAAAQARYFQRMAARNA
ncbi:nuclear speckle splicing regulatory protein 1 [Trichonephila inaurata madagascariensis]|uniref:Nuclear speckle splicing regulatory protein 1 n=1 Tax=Trichonephila inaurata madagascariensis TaxID=2747483 RepID=A0A8X6XGT6_9ARAC|nr:nuclear speckle splicing regulatory protein 1 [Trichonephila inaurata madagascariensis]